MLGCRLLIFAIMYFTCLPKIHSIVLVKREKYTKKSSWKPSQKARNERKKKHEILRHYYQFLFVNTCVAHISSFISHPVAVWLEKKEGNEHKQNHVLFCPLWVIQINYVIFTFFTPFDEKILMSIRILSGRIIMTSSKWFIFIQDA